MIGNIGKEWSAQCDLGFTRLILGLHPANERRRYFVTTSLIGWTASLESALWYIPNNT